MKVTTTLEWDAPFLRRMVAWVCRELDIPIRKVPLVAFCKSTRAFGGQAARNRIGVRIGDESNYPYTDSRDGLSFVLADRMEALIYLTGHELAHQGQHRRAQRPTPPTRRPPERD